MQKISNEQFDIVFNSSPSGLLIIENNKISKINSKGLEIFRYTDLKEIKNQDPSYLHITKADYDDFNLLVTRILKYDETFYEGQHLLRRSDNSLFWANLKCQSINKSKNSIIWSLEDITKTKIYEIELEQKVKQRTEELNKIHLDLKQEKQERQKIQYSLSNKEQQLLTLINSSPDIIIFKDCKGKWLECNDFVKQHILSNFTSEESLIWYGKDDLELCKLDLVKNREFHYYSIDFDKLAFEEKQLTHNEQELIVNDQIKTYDIIRVPIFYPSGERKGILLLGRDITDRKNIEIQSKYNELKIKNILESLPIGVMVINCKERRITHINDEVCFLLNKSPDELLNQPCSPKICNSLESSCSVMDYQESLKDVELLSSDGERFLLKSANVCNYEGESFIVETFMDITEVKRQEKIIYENEQKYKVIFEEAFDGILLIDTKTLTITDVNESALNSFKYDKETFLNKTIYDLLPFNDDCEIQKTLEQLIANRQVYFEEVHTLDASGHDLYFELQSTIMDLNNVSFFCVILRNITKQKELEKRLEVQQQDFYESLKKEVKELQTELNIINESTKKNIEEAAKLLEEWKSQGENSNDRL